MIVVMCETYILQIVQWICNIISVIMIKYTLLNFNLNRSHLRVCSVPVVDSLWDSQTSHQNSVKAKSNENQGLLSYSMYVLMKNQG